MLCHNLGSVIVVVGNVTSFHWAWDEMLRWVKNAMSIAMFLAFFAIFAVKLRWSLCASCFKDLAAVAFADP